MTVEHVLFDPKREQHPESLHEVVGQAVGAASVCWESMSGTGTFNDQRARVIVDEVIGWINEHYVALSDHAAAAQHESVWSPLDESRGQG